MRRSERRCLVGLRTTVAVERTSRQSSVRGECRRIGGSGPGGAKLPDRAYYWRTVTKRETDAPDGPVGGSDGPSATTRAFGWTLHGDGRRISEGEVVASG